MVWSPGPCGGLLQYGGGRVRVRVRVRVGQGQWQSPADGEVRLHGNIHTCLCVQHAFTSSPAAGRNVTTVHNTQNDTKHKLIK